VVTSVDPSFELYVDLGRHVDLKAEVFRIDKEMAAINRKLERSSKKLINSEFLNNAPPEVVKREKSKDRELRDMLEKLDGLRKEYASGAAL
jgi:valyl-tRNA synthetase